MIVFRDLRPVSGTNWDDVHGRHLCPRFILPPLNTTSNGNEVPLQIDFNAVELPQGIPKNDTDNLQNWTLNQKKSVKIGSASGGPFFPANESITRKVVITLQDS